jgi:NitT/TauT family transport system permease protein
MPTTVQKLFTVLVFLSAWEIVAKSGLVPSTILPSLSQSITWLATHANEAITATLFTLEMLGKAMGISIGAAFLLAAFSATSPRIRVSIDALISILNPIPGLALIPFAIMWFGFTPNAIMFVVVYSNVWALTINVTAGFSAIRKTLLEVGRNFGLTTPRYLIDVLIPAALPSIIAGIRISWALSWRAVVGIEMVFGAVGRVAGLGATIYSYQFLLDTPAIMGILLIIATIGFVVENILLSILVKKTVVKWGMQTGVA